MGFSTGLTIGKYELGRKLGEGGFGFVFVGRDLSLDREVALKFLHSQHTASPEILRRFLQEARSAAKVVHPGIVTVFECGQVTGTGTAADGVAFIAMELLHGESLADRLARSGRLEPRVAMEITRQIASALEAAHQAGIVHRDLKPDNVFLVTDPAMPGGERVKVLDFGIAKLAQAQGSGVQTQSMMVFGTPRYMSPEQCRSAANIDHRSDIYALGCILYELVVGEPPFQGETGELIAKHQLVPPSTARSIIGDLPEDLDTLISSLLAKDPAQRPQTMMAVQQALESGGAMAPGVAPTMLPDAGESLKRFTPPPGSLKALPSNRVGASSGPQRRSGSSPVPAVVPNRTTLGSATGQVDDVEPRPRRKASLILGGIAIAAIAGVVVVFAAGGSGSQDTAPATPAAATVTQPVLPQPSQPPPPVAVDQIELVITSTPKAEVFSHDNRLLGETPYRTKRKPDEGRLVFYVRAEGHKDARVLMAADRNDEQDVTLTPLVATAAVQPPPKDKTVKKPQRSSNPPRSSKPPTEAKTPSTTRTPARPTCGGRPCKPGELPDD